MDDPQAISATPLSGSAGADPAKPASDAKDHSNEGHRHSRRRRRRHTIHFDLTDTADNTFDRIIEGLLVAMLAFAPVAVGGVQAWSELILCLIAGAMGMVLCIKLICRPGIRFIGSWTYLPIALFLGLTLAQVLPLPMSLIEVISPHTAELKKSLLLPLPNGERFLTATTLSFYPEATYHNLRMLIAISAVYIVTLNTIRQQRQIERVLIAVTIIGVGVAGIGFAHLLAGARQLYGMYGALSGGWPIAPFINRNHFGQFMNLSLGAALGLLLMRIEQLIRSQRKDSTAEDQILLQVPPIMWAVGAGVVVLALGTFMSLSRGAILSLVAGGCAATITAQRQGMKGRIWVLAPLAWAVILLVALFGFDLIVGRFAVAIDQGADRSLGGRLGIVRDVLGAWKQFPLLGTGMGTFETVYPLFDTSTVLAVATHAEDEYAQILLEAGVAGLAIVLGFLVMVCRKYAVSIRSAPSLMASIATGLGFSLLTVVIQSFTDFGQHAPANAMLMAVVCALVVTLAEASRRTSAGEPKTVSGRMPLRLAATPIVAIVATTVLWQAWSCARAESHWFDAREVDARLSAHEWRGDSNDYITLISAASSAARERPDDARYQFWLGFYRWQAISRVRDATTGQLLLGEKQLQWAEQISLDLLQAAHLCPTYGPIYLLAGQIQRNILQKDSSGSALIQTAHRLSHTDPAANFEAALLDARMGNWDVAVAKMRHAAALDSRYLYEAMDALTRDLNRPDLAVNLAGEDVEAVRRIAALVEKSDTAASENVSRRLEELIQLHAADPHASADELVDAARLEFARKNHTAAAHYYRRALQVIPGRADVHLELAKALDGDGKTEEAIDEAQLAARLGAGEAAKSLVLELRMRPSTGPAR